MSANIANRQITFHLFLARLSERILAVKYVANARETAGIVSRKAAVSEYPIEMPSNVNER